MSGEHNWHEAPTLPGDLVRLEPLSLDHVDGLFAAASDEAFEFLRDTSPANLDEMADAVRVMLAHRDAGRRVPWTQVDVRNGAEVVAGTTSYWLPDPEYRTVEIGFTWLGKPWWRTGINTEAKLLLLTRAFEELGAVRVTWQTDVRNQRSQNAIARLGATREGVLRKNRTRRGGEWRDSALFSMTDDDWPTAKTRLSSLLRV